MNTIITIGRQFGSSGHIIGQKVAEYFNLDPTIIRLATVLLTVFWGTGILVYILAAIIIPTADRDFDRRNNEDVDNLKSANVDENESASSKESKSENGSGAPHSDSEFNEFFKK